MKKILLPFLILAAFVSCGKDDRDLSELHGKWESTEYIFRITPEDAVLQAAVEKDFGQKYGMFRLLFGPGDYFAEYRYSSSVSHDAMAMTSGNYFYNHGYKSRYVIYDSILGTSMAEIELNGDELIYRIDLTKRYEDPSVLEAAGVADVKAHPFDKIEIVMIFERAEFEVKW